MTSWKHRERGARILIAATTMAVVLGARADETSNNRVAAVPGSGSVVLVLNRKSIPRDCESLGAFKVTDGKEEPPHAFDGSSFAIKAKLRNLAVKLGGNVVYFPEDDPESILSSVPTDCAKCGSMMIVHSEIFRCPDLKKLR